MSEAQQVQAKADMVGLVAGKSDIQFTTQAIRRVIDRVGAARRSKVVHRS